MERTKNRELVTGKIPVRNAIIFAIVLGVLGFGILILGTNILTVCVAVLGVVVYLVLYTPLKPRSSVAPVIGSIAGAVPPVVGYTAVIGNLDAGAIMLFLILCLWQIPHFYAISIYRLEDYKAADIPILENKISSI